MATRRHRIWDDAHPVDIKRMIRQLRDQDSLYRSDTAQDRALQIAVDFGLDILWSLLHLHPHSFSEILDKLHSEITTADFRSPIEINLEQTRASIYNDIALVRSSPVLYAHFRLLAQVLEGIQQCDSTFDPVKVAAQLNQAVKNLPVMEEVRTLLKEMAAMEMRLDDSKAKLQCFKERFGVSDEPEYGDRFEGI